jgi:tRNA modification GTPase
MRDWEGTIVARITPLGYGGVGVVRLSGADAFVIVDRFVRVSGSASIRGVPPRYMVPAVIESGGEVWDRGLAVRFQSPRSFTGEDVVELHLHGNPLIVDRVVELAQRAGARVAQAGEFTMRAVLNGKLDLIQAEAVGETIAAESADAVRIAQRQLGGELSARLNTLRQRVVDAIARLELELDFSEEGYAFLGSDELDRLLSALRDEVETLLRNFRSGARLRLGPRVLLLGRPNAGKSSFFNAVLGYSRALVSDVAGTTRDYLEERLVHRGLVLHLVDTAGLRSTEDELEAEGVRRAWSLAADADFALYLVDALDPSAVAASGSELDEFRAAYPDVPVARVWTKVDSNDIGLADRSGLSVTISDSATIDRVLDHVAGVCRPALTDMAALVTERQAALLEEMRAALVGIDRSVDQELIAADLRLLLGPLSRLVGEVSNEDVLDSVFRNFCIGK